MGKKKGQPAGATRSSGLKVFAVRLPPDIVARVEDVARGLGLDEANFLRMLTVENLPTYEKRVERIRAGLPAE